MMARLDDAFWELKESAKWSLDVNERRRAIRQMANTYGKEAIQSIAEIRNVAAYDEIRNACIEAIKQAARGKAPKSLQAKAASKSGRKARNNARKRTSKKRTNPQ